MQADVLLHPFFVNRGDRTDRANGSNKSNETNETDRQTGLIRGMNLIDLNSVLTEKRGRPSHNEDGSVPLW